VERDLDVALAEEVEVLLGDVLGAGGGEPLAVVGAQRDRDELDPA
jgi:hypothetical protein